MSNGLTITIKYIYVINRPKAPLNVHILLLPSLFLKLFTDVAEMI